MRTQPSEPDPRLTRVLSARYLSLWVQLWLVAVFVLCIFPFGKITTPWLFTDKLVHALMYAVPAFFLTCIGYKIYRRLFYLFAFGIGVELVQSLLPYRSGDIWDALANSCGIAIGWLCARGYLRLLRAYKNESGSNI